jgi:hypothetical protein
VAGEEFDLVVSNPPFVISPGHRYTYRDAGLPADDLGRLLVQQAPAHLADGGTAVVLANWVHVRGQDWRERVAAWVAPTGCDAWIAQREVQDPAQYVGLWLRDAGGDSGPEHDRRYEAWLDELLDMEAEAIGFGWVVLHRGGTYGSGGPRIEDVAAFPRLPRGDEVGALVAARAAWADHDAFALLAARPRHAPALRLVHEERAGGDGRLHRWPPHVGLVDGWRPDVLLDVVGADLVGRLDGRTTVSEAAERVAAVHGLDPEDLIPAALIAVRGLVEDGLLVIPGTHGAT